MAIRTKRVYEPPGAEDGTRILLDRLWPRGIAKAQAAIDLWLRDVAPSSELRRCFAHRPERWAEFQARYHQELVRLDEPIHELVRLSRSGDITLLYAAQDRDRNNAVALRAYIDRWIAGTER
jgi:uncharacterized protein YeaO (DUF488 family)